MIYVFNQTSYVLQRNDSCSSTRGLSILIFPNQFSNLRVRTSRIFQFIVRMSNKFCPSLVIIFRGNPKDSKDDRPKYQDSAWIQNYLEIPTIQTWIVQKYQGSTRIQNYLGIPKIQNVDRQKYQDSTRIQIYGKWSIFFQKDVGPIGLTYVLKICWGCQRFIKIPPS